MNKQLLIKKGEGKNYDFSQDHCHVKLPFKVTGNCSMVEDSMKPGFYLPRHHHKIMTEVFYLLEGDFELIYDDEVIHLKSGDTAIVPPNVWHIGKSEKGGKMISIFVNGRFDEYLEKMATLSEADFANTEKMKAINEEFDIYNES